MSAQNPPSVQWTTVLDFVRGHARPRGLIDWWLTIGMLAAVIVSFLQGNWPSALGWLAALVFFTCANGFQAMLQELLDHVEGDGPSIPEQR